MLSSTPLFHRASQHLTATTGKTIYCLHERRCSPMPTSTSHATTSRPASLLAEHTWMVFNYVPRGYHGSSISSVWQCNSLCPAAMSAKLRQFTCSCSYIALGMSALPSILCIHLLPGTRRLSPQTLAVTCVTKSKEEVCLIVESLNIRQPKLIVLGWLFDDSSADLLHNCHPS